MLSDTASESVGVGDGVCVDDAVGLGARVSSLTETTQSSGIDAGMTQASRSVPPESSTTASSTVDSGSVVGACKSTKEEASPPCVSTCDEPKSSALAGSARASSNAAAHTGETIHLQAR